MCEKNVLLGGLNMAIRLNEDAELVAQIKAGLKRKGDYCPCRLQKTEDNKCICKEFREQIADPAFEGYCHCLCITKRKIDEIHKNAANEKFAAFFNIFSKRY